MRKSDFYYELPEALIAQEPVEPRSASRLLALEGDSSRLRDLQFQDLPQLLNAGDLLVFNDTRVIPARLFGEKDSGGRIEVMVERVLDDRRFLAQVRASKTPKPGRRLHLDGNTTVTVLGREHDLFELRLETGSSVMEVLQRLGHMPLPPYIQRPDRPEDRQRYQTVYARHPGAVAAPTAGLHFDEAMLERLQSAGVDTAFITLHVGAGTFQPLRVEALADHRLHSEYVEVDAHVCQRVAAARAQGGRVIAVGTTVVRALESVADEQGRLRPLQGETDIFIYPGYRFKVVDALLTNFHLPESSLLMLVCAFGGMEHVLRAYGHAVGQGYRFYSYGDAMFVTRCEGQMIRVAEPQ